MMLRRFRTEDLTLHLRYSHQQQRETPSSARSEPRVSDQRPTFLQLFSTRMTRFRVLQNNRRQTMPCFGASSSSTPTVPFSTADLLYNSEGRGDDYSNNEFYNREKEKVRSRDFDIAANRRPTSRSDTKRSFSLDKVSVDREKEDSRGLPNCFPPSKPATSLLRSNGVRNSLLRGRDPDELVAMGTIWSPNAQQRNTSTSGSNTNSGSGKSLGVTAASQACSIQPRRMPNVTTTTRQILVQQAGAPPSTASRPPASREVEPKYADPIPGAPGQFQQRMMELASLEGETVRWERTRKIRKKPKPEKDS